MGENNSLKGKTVSGLIWSFSEIIAGQGVQFIVLMVLARILTPEDFGIIGMIIVFIAISNSLIDSGFTQALIREKNANQVDYSTVFFFNLLMSTSLYMILYCATPFISRFFGVEHLTPLLRVLSLVIIINSFGIVQRVFLIKSINFKTQTKVSFVASLIAGSCSIIFALQGFGVWSLVIQTLTFQTIQTILLWVYNKWFPTFTFSIHSFKRLFAFGSKLLVSGLIDTFYYNIYFIIIGRLYPIAQLGYYTNASKLEGVITTSATSALQRVTYPVLSRIQDDENRLRSSFRKIIKTSAYVMFPLMTGLIAIADSLIPLIFGPNWMGTIIFYKLLCVAGMIYPLHAINLNILQVKGRSDLFLKLEIIKKSLLTLLIGASLFFSLGIIGLIVAGIINSYLSLYINAYYSAREISYSIFEQLRDIFPSFIISLLMGGFVYTIGSLIHDNHLLKLIVQISIGISFYAVTSWALKVKEFEALYQIIGTYISIIKKRKLKEQ